MGRNDVVSFTDFIYELQNEWTYQQDGGTSYRRKIAELSLKIARQVGEVTPFLQRNIAKQIISHLLPNLDHHQIEDIAKMLHTIAKDLHLHATLSPEVKAYVQQKRQHRKTLSLKRPVD